MKKVSVTLCTVFVILFLAVLVASVGLAPYLVSRFGTHFGWSELNRAGILYSFYCCCVPAGVALGCLLTLLHNIRRGRPFSKRTGVLIGVISWCCTAVAVITLIGSFFYFPLLSVCIIMAFMFLIVRVVRLCFQAATELDEDSSLTI